MEVEFSSANSPDRPLFVCVAGGTLFQKSEVLASLACTAQETRKMDEG